MNRVLSTLNSNIVAYAQRTAISDGIRSWSYSELGEIVTNVSEKLRSYVPELKCRIGIYLPNSAKYIFTYYALMAAEHLPFLIDNASNKTELAAIRQSCGVFHFIIEERFFEKFPLENFMSLGSIGDGLLLISSAVDRNAVPQALEDTVTCRFTSGSGGIPKCLEFSDEAIVSAAETWVAGTKLTIDDKVLCLAALSNGLAFNTSLLSTFLVGGELHIYTGIMMAARVLDAVDQRKITRIVGFPAIYRHLVLLESDSATTANRLNHAISASAVLDPKIRKEFHTRFGVDISDYYGIAETGPVTFETDPKYQEGLGRPLPGVDIRITSAVADGFGKVQVKTKSFASRYLNHKDKFESKKTADGYYATDDLGEIIDGRLYLRGKTSKTGNIGGRIVHLSEVNNFIGGITGVKDCEIFVDTDKNMQDILHAVIVADAGMSRGDIVSSCRADLAGFKIPSRITFVDTIPRSGVGKITFNSLRETVKNCVAAEE